MSASGSGSMAETTTGTTESSPGEKNPFLQQEGLPKFESIVPEAAKPVRLQSIFLKSLMVLFVVLPFNKHA